MKCKRISYCTTKTNHDHCFIGIIVDSTDILLYHCFSSNLKASTTRFRFLCDEVLVLLFKSPGDTLLLFNCNLSCSPLTPDNPVSNVDDDPLLSVVTHAMDRSAFELYVTRLLTSPGAPRKAILSVPQSTLGSLTLFGSNIFTSVSCSSVTSSIDMSKMALLTLVTDTSGKMQAGCSLLSMIMRA